MLTLYQTELCQRIQAFILDCPGAQLSFSQRLARDNRWTLDYTKRVIEEYKKFAFLAITSGHAVTPSDQIDQVWHLHLAYTHSYWDEFCTHVLQTPLHHGPTKGGLQERQRFREQYAQTLASYRHFFEQEPPSDIWPPAHIRFGHDIHFSRVNTQDYWIVPKLNFKGWLPNQLARRWQVPLLVMGLLTIGGCRDAESIEWASSATLEDFFGLYAWTGVLGLLIAFILGGLLQTINSNSKVTLFLLALVAFIESALCLTRTSMGVLTLSRTDFLCFYGLLIASTLLLDRWCCQWATSFQEKTARSRTAIVYQVTPCLIWLFWLGVYGLGAARFFVGINRQQPVGFLAFVCTSIAAYMFMFWEIRLDRPSSESWLSRWLIRPILFIASIPVLLIAVMGFFSIASSILGQLHFFWRLWVGAFMLLFMACAFAIVVHIFAAIASLDFNQLSYSQHSPSRYSSNSSSSSYSSNRYSSNSSSRYSSSRSYSISLSGSSNDSDDGETDSDGDGDADGGCSGCGGCGCGE